MCKPKKYSQPHKVGIPSNHGIYYLVKDVDPILNSLQQLKAEIAALVNHCDTVDNAGDEIDFESVIERLRQLSAV